MGSSTKLVLPLCILALIAVIIWFAVRKSSEQSFASFKPHYSMQDCQNYLTNIGSYLNIEPGLWIATYGNIELPSDHTSGSECLSYWSNGANYVDLNAGGY